MKNYINIDDMYSDYLHCTSYTKYTVKYCEIFYRAKSIHRNNGRRKTSFISVQRKLTILTTTIIIQEVHNYKCGNTIPDNISLSVTCIV